MNYLIDTCVISELVKPYPAKQVVAWLENTPSEQLFLSVITVGEIRKGITKLPNSKKKSMISKWLYFLLQNFHDRILNLDLEVAEIWGEMLANCEKSGVQVPTLDSLIASIAKAHNLTLVTRNEKDFKGCSISTMNPWDYNMESRKQE